MKQGEFTKYQRVLSSLHLWLLCDKPGREVRQLLPDPVQPDLEEGQGEQPGLETAAPGQQGEGHHHVPRPQLLSLQQSSLGQQLLQAGQGPGQLGAAGGVGPAGGDLAGLVLRHEY